MWHSYHKLAFGAGTNQQLLLDCSFFDFVCSPYSVTTSGIHLFIMFLVGCCFSNVVLCLDGYIQCVEFCFKLVYGD